MHADQKTTKFPLIHPPLNLETDLLSPPRAAHLAPGLGVLETALYYYGVILEMHEFNTYSPSRDMI